MICECKLVTWCNWVIWSSLVVLVIQLSLFVMRLTSVCDGEPPNGGCFYYSSELDKSCYDCPDCKEEGGEATVCNTTLHPTFPAECGIDDTSGGETSVPFACKLSEAVKSFVQLFFLVVLPLFIHRFKRRLGKDRAKTLKTCWCLLAVPAVLFYLAEIIGLGSAARVLRAFWIFHPVVVGASVPLTWLRSSLMIAVRSAARPLRYLYLC